MVRPSHGGNLAWAATLAGCPPENLLDFSASINPLGPPESAIAAISSQLAHIRNYPDPEYTELRSLLGELHGLEPNWILPGNGAAELLTWAARDLSRLEQVLLPTPAFGDYTRALNSFNSCVITCPLVLTTPAPCPHNNPETDNQASLYAQALHAAIQSSKPLSWGLLLNNPHNPTGQLLPATALQPYLEMLPLVVVDEAFMDFLPPEQQLRSSLIPLVADYPNLVILRSLTKFYSLPGLRLGYAVGHPDRLKYWQQWRDPWPVNSLAVAAAKAVLRDRDFQHLTWNWLPPARQQFFQGLLALPGLTPLPSAANFLLVQCQKSVLEVQEQLLRRSQILIRDCLSFPELGDRYFRVAVRREAENERLLTALAEVL